MDWIVTVGFDPHRFKLGKAGRGKALMTANEGAQQIPDAADDATVAEGANVKLPVGVIGIGCDPQIDRVARNVKDKRPTDRIGDGFAIDDEIQCRKPVTSDRLKDRVEPCLLYTSPSPRDQRGSRMPSSA